MSERKLIISRHQFGVDGIFNYEWKIYEEGSKTNFLFPYVVKVVRLLSVLMQNRLKNSSETGTCLSNIFLPERYLALPNPPIGPDLMKILPDFSKTLVVYDDELKNWIDSGNASVNWHDMSTSYNGTSSFVSISYYFD